MIPRPADLQALLARAERGLLSAQDISWLAPLIDHTALKPELTEEQLRALCREAREFTFGAVCVRVNHVAFCVTELAGSAVKVASVVGFPSGLEPTAEKRAETRAAVAAGAREIDMVLNLDFLKRGDLTGVYADIHAVVEAAGCPVKVILETCLLDRDQKLIASALAKAAGAAYLKTSTGFSTGGATAEDVFLLRSVAGPEIGVKASGGVRSLVDALRMVLAGADRLGTSAGTAILKSSQPTQSGVY